MALSVCVLALCLAHTAEAKGKEKKIHVVHVPKPVYIKKPVPVYLEKKVPVVKIKPVYVPKPIIVKKKEYVPVVKKVHIVQKVKVPVIKKVPVPYPVKKIKVSSQHHTRHFPFLMPTNVPLTKLLSSHITVEIVGRQGAGVHEGEEGEEAQGVHVLSGPAQL